MQRSVVGFEASYRRHLAAEQRRAVLDALASSFDDESTVGEIVDAANALGFAGLGDLSLADLADALLSDARAGQSAARDTASNDAEDAATEDDDEPEADDDEADDDDDAEAEDDDDEEAEAAPPAKTRGRPAAKAPARGKAAKAAPVKATAAAKPAAKGKGVTKISLDDRMSLAEAAAVLLPLVRSIGQATMQQLEQATAGAGRRKLRFHIGQLVRNGRLERHGMGRGTYYTVV